MAKKKSTASKNLRPAEREAPAAHSVPIKIIQERVMALRDDLFGIQASYNVARDSVSFVDNYQLWRVLNDTDARFDELLDLLEHVTQSEARWQGWKSKHGVVGAAA